PSNGAPMAGNIRSDTAGKSSEPSKDGKAVQRPAPAVVDIESTQQPPKPDDKPPPPSNGAPSLTLPNTLLPGATTRPGDPPARTMDEAINQQKDLLAEFEKIADELNRLLANLEGSTLVKRLKAASRLQYRVAGRLGDQVGGAFGVPSAAAKQAQRILFTQLSKEEAKSSQDVSN